jgi:membrane protein DedA with SNARE-associated domain/rhodanese-related sulfurtransferase
MSQILSLLVRHGGLVLFAVVLLEQLGLPLPALPWILAAGALAANGQLRPMPALAGVLLACLIADAIWFGLGRRGGPRVLRMLCRISLQPDSCVRRTQDLFHQYGMRGVVVAKFLPGLSTVIPPLAGMSGVGLRRFLLFDGLGSLLYGGGFLLLGVLFRHQLDRVLAALVSLGNGGLVAVAGLVAVYVGFKYLQRRRLLRQLRGARITVDELRRRQLAGEKLLILDLRARAELERDPSLIPGARHVSLDELDRCEPDLPRDRDIILYCSCPNEVSSARMAFRLHRKGINRVRPLLGGIDAWREQHYPTLRCSAPAAPVPQPAVLAGSAAAPSGAPPAVVVKAPSGINLPAISGEVP